MHRILTKKRQNKWDTHKLVEPSWRAEAQPSAGLSLLLAGRPQLISTGALGVVFENEAFQQCFSNLLIFLVTISGQNSANIMRAGLCGAATGAVFGGIGGYFNGFSLESGVGHYLSHATAGGVIEELQGGKFAHGFISAGVTKYVMYNSSNSFGEQKHLGHILARTAAAGAVGGTVSQITGGKFVNGARTAAYAHLLNQEFANTVTDAVANAQEVYKNRGPNEYETIEGLTVTEHQFVKAMDGVMSATIPSNGPELVLSVIDDGLYSRFKATIFTVDEFSVEYTRINSSEILPSGTASIGSRLIKERTFIRRFQTISVERVGWATKKDVLDTPDARVVRSICVLMLSAIRI